MNQLPENWVVRVSNDRADTLKPDHPVIKYLNDKAGHKQFDGVAQYYGIWGGRRSFWNTPPETCTVLTLEEFEKYIAGTLTNHYIIH